MANGLFDLGLEHLNKGVVYVNLDRCGLARTDLFQVVGVVTWQGFDHFPNASNLEGKLLALVGFGVDRYIAIEGADGHLGVVW